MKARQPAGAALDRFWALGHEVVARLEDPELRSRQLLPEDLAGTQGRELIAGTLQQQGWHSTSK